MTVVDRSEYNLIGIVHALIKRPFRTNNPAIRLTLFQSHSGGRGFESRRSRQHSLTIGPQVRVFQRLGARRIGKLVVQASIVQGGGLRQNHALARQTEPRLCVVAVELS